MPIRKLDYGIVLLVVVLLVVFAICKVSSQNNDDGLTEGFMAGYNPYHKSSKFDRKPYYHNVNHSYTGKRGVGDYGPIQDRLDLSRYNPGYAYF